MWVFDNGTGDFKQGSVEAIREVLQALPQDTVALRFLLQAAGEVSASDIDLAVASNAVVVGFNVGLQPGIQTQADNAGVEIRLYKVIYDLVDDIRKAMEGLLDSVEVSCYLCALPSQLHMEHSLVDRYRAVLKGVVQWQRTFLQEHRFWDGFGMLPFSC